MGSQGSETSPWAWLKLLLRSSTSLFAALAFGQSRSDQILMTLAGKKVLFVSYNGMLDPLGQSQVIPYLKELSRRGVQFTLLSFERDQAFGADGEQLCRTLRDSLSRCGIEWHYLRYHQRPSIPATAYDVFAGIRLSRRLVRSRGIEMVHARAHIPAVIALALKRKFGVKMIFDVRGLMAEEYLDAGHWQPGSLAARSTKTMEARMLRATDGIVTLTGVLWEAMQRWPALRGRQVAHETIPCCIDQDNFCFDAAARTARRTELGVKDRLVLVYSGSIGGWYMTEEMAAFFAALRQKRPDAFFLWLTTGNRQIVDRAMTKQGMAADDYQVVCAASQEVPSLLSAADLGIAFYRPGTSRLGTSPVKVSEYLSCGLPIVINAGIGDSDLLVTRERVGALVRELDVAGYAAAVNAANEFLKEPEKTRMRSREVAETWFNLQTVGGELYARLYENVLGN
jgi:glycosyltransferase involved in cell wall biosynthesis